MQTPQRTTALMTGLNSKSQSVSPRDRVRVFLAGLACTAATLTATSSADASDWPQFRGPTGQNTTQDRGFPTTWSTTENVVWKAALPNRGNESPVVAGPHVFVTSATDDGIERRLHCFNRVDGSELWSRAITVEKKEETHQTNPFGAATPAVAGERVVVWHGSAGLYCYDLAGEQQWHADLGKVGHIWGYGSSPVIEDGRVFLNYGPGREQFLVAVDLQTGNTIWRLDENGGNDNRDGRMAGSWSTPVLADVDGQRQLICSMPTRVVGVNPANGELLWWCDGLSGKNGNLVYTSPLIAGNIGVAMGGYTGPAIGFRLGGKGDVTESQRLWQASEKNPQRIGSGVVIGNHIFMANAGPGTLQCLDLMTGAEKWSARGPGGNHWGSLIFADEKLYVTNQSGATLVMAPNPDEYQLLAENPLGEASNSTPAFSDGHIFIRTDKHLYCIGASAKE